jgi:hypothetical protein
MTLFATIAETPETSIKHFETGSIPPKKPAGGNGALKYWGSLKRLLRSTDTTRSAVPRKPFPENGEDVSKSRPSNIVGDQPTRA